MMTMMIRMVGVMMMMTMTDNDDNVNNNDDDDDEEEEEEEDDDDDDDDDSVGGSVVASMMTNWRGVNKQAFYSLMDINWCTGQNCSGLMFYNTKINQAKELQLVKNMWFVCLNHVICVPLWFCYRV